MRIEIDEERMGNTADHYIPQFHLRLFARDSQDGSTVHFADLKNGHLSNAAPSKLAVEHGYNSARGFAISVGGKPAAGLEAAYSRLEGIGAPAVQSLADLGRSAEVEDVDRERAALYVALQATRAPAFRELQLKLAETVASGFQSELMKSATDAGLSEEEVLSRAPKLDLQSLTRIGMLARAVNIARPYFEHQKWALLRAVSGAAFLMADACVSVLKGVVRPDVVDFSGANPNVEFVLPVCSSLALLIRDDLSRDMTRDVTADEVQAINKRTVYMADRWIYAADKETLDGAIRSRVDQIPHPINVG
jgi:hypothetical protein